MRCISFPTDISYMHIVIETLVHNKKRRRRPCGHIQRYEYLVWCDMSLPAYKDFSEAGEVLCSDLTLNIGTSLGMSFMMYLSDLEYTYDTYLYTTNSAISNQF